MCKLAEAGIIPLKLAKIAPPIYIACLKGKQHRRPWKGRGKHVRIILWRSYYNFPGAQINVNYDQVYGQVGRLKPQVRGILTEARYSTSTVFVDHFTELTYVHLMTNTGGNNTSAAKNMYEHLFLQRGYRVLAYFVDNDRFAEATFKNNATDKAQSISCCETGHHSQNRIAKNRIKTLSQDSRAMLAHCMDLWLEVITKAFWL